MRLPAGRHGLSPDVVSANQRERLIDAFARVVAEKGFRATTVADITSRAAVSRNVFYDQFGSKDECFIAAYEVIRAHVREMMIEAAEPYPEHPEKLIASLRVLLAYFATEPELARLVLVEPLSAGSAMSAHHEEALGVLVARLRDLANNTTEPSSRTDEVLILGVISLVARRINVGEAEGLEDLLPELAEILLSSYLDEEQIAEIVAKVEAGA
jgi:AcrR family transcriptional regulator